MFGNTDGYINFGDLRADLGLANYPRMEWTYEVFSGYIETRTLEVSGLNVFQQFDALKRYSTLSYTLDNNFRFPEIRVQLRLHLRITFGTWATNGPPTNQPFPPKVLDAYSRL